MSDEDPVEALPEPATEIEAYKSRWEFRGIPCPHCGKPFPPFEITSSTERTYRQVLK